MRILIVSTDYLPLIGGVAQHVSELARALHRAGDEVVVLTVDRLDHWADLKRPTREEPATPDRPRVVRVPWVVNRRIKLVTGLASSRLSFARFIREVHALAASFRPEVIHWHAVDLWRDTLWQGIPAARVWTNHTSDFITGLNRRGLRRRYAAEARAAHRIIAPSEQLRTLTVALGRPDDRTHFISNGVDPDRFPPGADGTAWRDRLALRPGERMVLCPRRLDHKNGVLVFVQAALLLLAAGRADTRFVLAGDASGASSAYYARAVLRAVRQSAHAGHFALLGAVGNAELPGLYALADVVVVPSFIEATSIATLEAMACARPVVASRVGGLPFLVREGESGRLVEPGDPAALAAALDDLLGDPARVRAMGEAARRRVEQELAWPAIARQTRAVYEAALRDCAS